MPSQTDRPPGLRNAFAHGLQGGAALDTLNGHEDSSMVRTLTMCDLLICSVPIAFTITGLFLAAAAYAAVVTGLLRRWIRVNCVCRCCPVGLCVPVVNVGG